jgi:hypothetical protein
VWFDFLYNVCLKHFTFQKELSEIWSKMYIGLHVKHPLFLSDFNETLILSADFTKILKYQISLESVQWEPSCFVRTDGRTDMKLIIAFRNFENAPKACYEYKLHIRGRVQMFPACQSFKGDRNKKKCYFSIQSSFISTHFSHLWTGSTMPFKNNKVV